MSPNGMALVLGTRTKVSSTLSIQTLIKYIYMKREFEVTCKSCGKKFTVVEEETKFPIKGDKYYCCRSCANRRIHSEETKNKISNTLINRHRHKQPKTKKYICEFCGKEFESVKKKRFCSKECSNNSMRQKVSNQRRKEIEEGTFQGWKTRNIISYAEKFWEQVLNNNNIPYEREYILWYGSNIGERYFLDFYIKIGDHNIDLEIDGKQHKYQDRVISDKKRDQIVSSMGFEIYRIDWNQINSKQGKIQMKNKIDNFICYIKQLINHI